MNTITTDHDTLQYSGEWMTYVQDSLLEDDKLSGLAKLLYICIKSFACPKNPCPFPGRETLKRMLGGCSDDSFWRYKRELIESGWIGCVQERGHGGSFGRNHYTIFSKPNPDNKSPDQKKPGPVNRIAVKPEPKEYPLEEGEPSTHKKGECEKRASQLKNALGALYHREPGVFWPYADEVAILEIARSESCESELDEILDFKTRCEPRYFPNSLPRLLANWTATLDRARQEVSPIKPKSIEEKEVSALCRRIRSSL